MKRREFITLLGGAAVAWPLAARAQQSNRTRRIGVLMLFTESDPEAQTRVAAFQKGLHELGWTEGRNVLLDYRWPAGDPDRTRANAAELVRSAPDVLVATSPAALAALKNETRTIPIVFLSVADPVGSGFVASLAHPGGNITGFTNFEYAIAGKWLELLKDVVPRTSRMMVILNPENPTGPGYVRTIKTVAPRFGVQLTVAPVHDTAEIDEAINGFAREPDGGLIVLPDVKVAVNRELIVKSALRHRLPAVYAFRYWVSIGGLMAYGPDHVYQFWQAATYIDRILKGAKPANLPVQAPTKFELLVNLKTANALGLTIRREFLLRADEVIE